MRKPANKGGLRLRLVELGDTQQDGLCSAAQPRMIGLLPARVIVRKKPAAENTAGLRIARFLYRGNCRRFNCGKRECATEARSHSSLDPVIRATSDGRRPHGKTSCGGRLRNILGPKILHSLRFFPDLPAFKMINLKQLR